ncbi:hypothetical protein [Propioniciclava coleopterorum]|uniref:hypothetical protein n=1 Tax=Propioniciclava coleopterorum TaxID=2714937 RepID=UPI001FE26D65|nr:hypothetical protein [Propioniciclava coleopterorum]
MAFQFAGVQALAGDAAGAAETFAAIARDAPATGVRGWVGGRVGVGRSRRGGVRVLMS